MPDMLTASPDGIGFLVWIIWAVIGLAVAVVAQRIMPDSQSKWFYIIIAVVAAVIGGYLSVQFIGSTPAMLLLLSVLAAVFGAGIMMWIVTALIIHFTPKK